MTCVTDFYDKAQLSNPVAQWIRRGPGMVRLLTRCGKGGSMLRKSYLLGVAGLVMMGLGVSLYLRGSVYRLSLLYWLGGPLLCFAGAALFMGAILCPVFHRHEEHPEPPDTAKLRGQSG